MTRGLLALGLLAASAFADIPPARAETDGCSTDAQCVITTFDGCCGGCCPREPYAMSAAALKVVTDRCRVVDCERTKSCGGVCAAVVPEPVSSFRAACEAGRCVAKPARAECREDAECRVVHVSPPAGSACFASPCGCCPVNAALPVEQRLPVAPEERSSPKPAAKDQPRFGLSAPSGARQRPEPVQCAPCPRPEPASAACVAGTCALVPPRPVPRPLPPG